MDPNQNYPGNQQPQNGGPAGMPPQYPQAPGQYPDSRQQPAPQRQPYYMQNQPNWPAFMQPDGRPADPSHYYPPGTQAPQPMSQYNTMANGYAAPQRKSPLKALIVFSLFILLLGGAGAYAFVALKKPETPDAVFRKSLETALSTSSYTQHSVDQKWGADMTLLADISDVKSPLLSAKTKISAADVTVNLNSYGSFKDYYFQLANYQDGSTAYPKDLKDKWVQLRKDGKNTYTGTNILSTFGSVGDPRLQVFGEFIVGNFAAKDRTDLVDYVIKQNVYGYDAKAVTEDTLAGHKVFKYKVKIDGKKLQAYNEKVAKLMAVDAPTADDLDSYAKDQTYYEYIDRATYRPLKIETSGDEKISVTYSNWNATKLPAKPQKLITLDEFKKQMDAAYNDNADSGSAAAKDTERATDINAIRSQVEAYYAENGDYPSFTDMNDKAFRAASFASLTADMYFDPDSSSDQFVNKPTKNAYAYIAYADQAKTQSCDNKSLYTCQYYKLVYYTSDGTEQSKESLN